MELNSKDYPSPSTLKWAMLLILLRENRAMKADEINRLVAFELKISSEKYDAILENGKQYVPYRLAWERTKCKKLGYIEKVLQSPGTWRLTEKGLKVAAYKRIRNFKSN